MQRHSLHFLLSKIGSEIKVEDNHNSLSGRWIDKVTLKLVTTSFANLRCIYILELEIHVMKSVKILALAVIATFVAIAAALSVTAVSAQDNMTAGNYTESGDNMSAASESGSGDISGLLGGAG